MDTSSGAVLATSTTKARQHRRNIRESPPHQAKLARISMASIHRGQRVPAGGRWCRETASLDGLAVFVWEMREGEHTIFPAVIGVILFKGM